MVSRDSPILNSLQLSTNSFQAACYIKMCFINIVFHMILVYNYVVASFIKISI